MRHAIGRTFALGALGLMSVFVALPSHSVANAATTKEKLTVKITDTGTVWGKVTITPGSKTCSAATCHYSFKQNTKMTLKETPTNRTTWPFCHWVQNGKARTSAKTFHFKLTKAMTVTALYTVPGNCSS
jgi:hypothetical protein